MFWLALGITLTVAAVAFLTVAGCGFFGWFLSELDRLGPEDAASGDDD